MAIFDYLRVAFAFLYTAAAMRLIGGLAPAMVPARRDWMHASLVLTTLLMVADSYWSFWSLRIVTWTLPSFLLALLVPGLLYFCASVLVPEKPNDVASWRLHYESVRSRYFKGLAGLVVVMAVISFLLLDMPWAHPAHFGHAGAFVLAVVGFSVSNRRAHGAAVMILISMVLAMTLTFATQPAWLNQ